MSACRSSASLEPANSTPASWQRSAVRFWLQAMTFMPIAWQILATRVPSLPSPITPSVLPSMSGPIVLCQNAPFLSRSLS